MADPGYISGGTLLDGEAWIGLSKQTLASDVSTVTFTSPNDGSSKDWSQFMDMVLIVSGRGTYTGTGSVSMYAKLNNDSNTSTDGGSYESHRAYYTGSGSATGQNFKSSLMFVGAIAADGQPTNAFATTVCYFYDINCNTKFKNSSARVGLLGDGTAGEDYVATIFSGWRGLYGAHDLNLSSILLSLSTNNFKTGSTFDLFGILPRMVNA